MVTSHDVKFKDLVLANKLATAEELEECLKTLETYKEAGIIKPLSSIILEKGYLTIKQIRAVRQLQGETSEYIIPGFTILNQLGSGGLGIVYKARQDNIGRIVALKIMYANLLSNEDYVKRFIREASVSVKLDHKNIVRGIDFGEADGTYYFAMEYIEGSNIKDLLQQKGKFDEQEAVSVIYGIAQALKHAEEHNLIHRDIKPENIILTTKGVPKLCDLGLAKIIDDDSSVTRTGIIVGTPHYIPPEQALGQKDIDIRSDIYSLGVTFYHMVTGEVPYTGDTVVSIISQHLSEEIPDPKSINPRLSDDISGIITKMMAKEKEGRYQTSQELIVDLELFLKKYESSITPTKVDLGSKGPRKILEFVEAATVDVNVDDVRKEQFKNLADAQRTQIKSGKELGKSKNTKRRTVKQKFKRIVRSIVYTIFITSLLISCYHLYLKKDEYTEYWRKSSVYKFFKGTDEIEKITIPLPEKYVMWQDYKDVQRTFIAQNNKLLKTNEQYTSLIKDMVFISDGSYRISDKTIQVKGFWLDRYEVTNAQYHYFCKQTKHKLPGAWIKKQWDKKGIPAGAANLPVVNVSFYDASLYAKWRGKRLPTVFEWEYAVITSKGYNYPWGKNYLLGAANVDTGHPKEVGFCVRAKTPSGIFDMAGNVWEWTNSYYKNNRRNMIIKGGSFAYKYQYSKATYRDGFFPHGSRNDIGFRCALDKK